MGKNNKFFKAYLLTGAITLGVIGAAQSSAFAATNSTTAPSDGIQGLKVKIHQNLDDATKEKIQSIMEDAKTKLAELGVKLPEKHVKVDRFTSLDDATKEKVQAIMDKVKDGSLTREDAQKQLTELGVDLPFGRSGMHGSPFANLDDATKEKVQVIMNKVKDGSLSHEDAQKHLTELGVDLPFSRGASMHGSPFANLDDATKEKVQAIMDKVKSGSLSHEDAQKQLTELGVDLPFGRSGMHGSPFANLDDATKEKVQAIMDKVKDGSLTREDAQKQLTELGVEPPIRGGKHLDPFANLDDAIKAKAQDILDDAKTQIKELVEK